MMTHVKSERKKPPVAPTSGGQSKSVEAIDNPLIANLNNDDNRLVAFRAAGGATWSYRGKRGRVLAMLASMGEGVTQWDTLPCFRHARYRLATAGCLIKQPDNSRVAQ